MAKSYLQTLKLERVDGDHYHLIDPATGERRVVEVWAENDYWGGAALREVVEVPEVECP